MKDGRFERHSSVHLGQSIVYVLVIQLFMLLACCVEFIVAPVMRSLF